eukprot:scaffold209587_cov30-Tisochrysis_lutea.AAC.2
MAVAYLTAPQQPCDTLVVSRSGSSPDGLLQPHPSSLLAAPRLGVSQPSVLLYTPSVRSLAERAGRRENSGRRRAR